MPNADKLKVKKEKVLIKPKDIKPTSPKFEVLSVMNPGVERLEDGRIILYVRVIERLKNFDSKNFFYSPRYIGKKKTYRIDDSTYKSFQDWCSRKGLDVSTAIRGSIGLLMKKGSIEELLKNSEIARALRTILL